MGADHTFNPKLDTEYLKKIADITNGGCHAAVNFTNSNQAYDATPSLLRVAGVMMIVGIPPKPITFDAMEISMRKYVIRGACNGIPQEMGACIEFSAEHNIKPHINFYKLEQIHEMMDLVHAGKAQGRVVVKFD